MKKITVYSTTTCPYCKMLKAYLNEKKINFADKVVDLDYDAMQEMVKLSEGFTGVPFTIIDKGNSELVKVKGFDKERINQALDL